MALKRPQRYSSFYESFSDLIFGTMAIFIMLMFVFLALIKQSDEQRRKELEAKLAAAKTQAAQMEQEAEKTREQIRQMAKTIIQMDNAVRTKGLELVVAVDRSGSMGEGIARMKAAIKTFAEVIPEYAPLVKISVVAYHESLGTTSPLVQVQARSRDKSASFDELANFLDSVTAQGGSVPVEDAINESLAMFDVDFDGFQIFMLLGDAGPFEPVSSGHFGPDSPSRIFGVAQQWASGHERRKVLTVYSPAPPGSPQYSDDEDAKALNRQFFSQLPKAVGQPENFTENPADMLAFLMRSIVIRD
jgi:von Willebrand factor type A domain